MNMRVQMVQNDERENAQRGRGKEWQSVRDEQLKPISRYKNKITDIMLENA